MPHPEQSSSWTEYPLAPGYGPPGTGMIAPLGHTRRAGQPGDLSHDVVSMLIRVTAVSLRLGREQVVVHGVLQYTPWGIRLQEVSALAPGGSPAARLQGINVGLMGDVFSCQAALPSPRRRGGVMNGATTVSERLAAAGLILPPAPAALGQYVPAARVGDLVFTSGQLPMRGGTLVTSGLVGAEVSLSAACDCARQAALNALAAASTVCELDKVARVVKLVGYVASASRFTSQPAVINGASEVFAIAFQEAGVHAREAVGVARLPLDAPVEVSVVLSLSP